MHWYAGVVMIDTWESTSMRCIHLHGSCLLVAIVAAGAVPMCYSTEAAAATVAVSNCNDSGPGSLRSAVGATASGSTIDARSLSCPAITLTREIVVPQADLKVVGSGTRRLTLDGNYAGRIFNHTGKGTLTLQSLWIVHGREYVQTALGGCIRSLGNVSLDSIHMHECHAEGRRPPDYDGVGAGAFAGGGAIHAVGNVSLVRSQIHASSASTFTGYGGGIASFATVTLYRSRVYGNDARDGGGISAHGVEATYSLIDHNTATEAGGIRSYDGVFLLRSAIADNETSDYCGGMCVTGTTRIVDSTLSRNGSLTSSAAGFDGDVAIYNSTIAANHEGSNQPGCGMAIGRFDAGYTLHLVSTIVAANRCMDGSYMLDIGGTSGPITGSHNIVRSASEPLPSDTIHANPRLGTLADNGGPTPTMALLNDSPAIDRGSNPLGLSYDQRGNGFPRSCGRTDIGAFER